ncbi:LOW QUALITY PROTEIN: 39S ribosomal protein L1, mitochondrial-like [Sciurus carolinensis]|uniref:LOW QUALITY PROTEIN: 39S ribosomal protein L1, mitochondrial-like n=1 Tax=Sciurus carolinensis TaxID=30640 RepID=UPI001FB2CD4F|nr:LOW QUALITY PROTEIN: 39S ribosomal protein L1, mitochondrial-like [Sciurus carolinensis]
MVAAVRCLGRVLIHHQRHNPSKMVYQTFLYPYSLNIQVSNRHFAAATKPAKKTKRDTKGEASDEKKDEIEKIKSYPYMEGEPEDDVYLKCLYPRQIYEVEKAVQFLKKFQILDFTNPKQGVCLDLTLDMALRKKNASEIKIAEENGAAFAGGTNLIQKILDDEIQVDVYVAVTEIMPELNPLKKKLKKKFPRLARNSIGRDIPKMLELFKTGREIRVDEERENFLSTQIATLDMSSDQIATNLQAVINEVCKHRPLNLCLCPFVVRAFLRSAVSEGLLLKIDPLLPKEVETKESNQEAA